MPYKIKKKSEGRFRVTGPSGVHAKGTTKEKAQAQMRLLQGIEHGWRPTGRKSSLKQKGVALSSYAPKKKRR